MVVADVNNIFELTGNGDVLEPESGVIGIGSGGSYALGKYLIVCFICISLNYSWSLAAALALIDRPDLDAEEIVRKSMKIAGDICVYTNHNLTLEKVEPKALEVPKKEMSPGL